MGLGSGTAMRDLCMPRNRGQVWHHVHDPEHAMCQMVFRNSVALELSNAGWPARVWRHVLTGVCNRKGTALVGRL